MDNQTSFFNPQYICDTINSLSNCPDDLELGERVPSLIFDNKYSVVLYSDSTRIGKINVKSVVDYETADDPRTTVTVTLRLNYDLNAGDLAIPRGKMIRDIAFQGNQSGIVRRKDRFPEYSQNYFKKDTFDKLFYEPAAK